MTYAAGFLGFGICPMGTTPYGIGVPATITTPKTIVYRNADGNVPDAQLTGAKIDPTTGQYVFDSTGNIIGQSTMQQLVLLAWKTALDSSAIQGLGVDFSSVGTITDDTPYQLSAIMTSAVQSYIDQGLMEIIDINVDRFAVSGMVIRVRWRDLTTGVEDTFSQTI